MHANSMCIPCIIDKQEKQIKQFSDENKKSEYMSLVSQILHEHGNTESAPGLTEMLNQLYERFWGKMEDYSSIKEKYNELLLGMEKGIEQQLCEAQDAIKECIKYVCVANYIDFSAVENVNENTFSNLLEKASDNAISDEEYSLFRNDLEHAERLVYLIDNCGEIVLDKIFMKLLKEAYPKLQITAIVRGGNVINDATIEDARQVGLVDYVPCIGNGNQAPGTIIKRLSKEAKQVIYDADVIISKGQGNFESLYGEGLNPYYFFLCKCELFVKRFGLKKYQSVFAKEERIRIKE